MRAYKEWCIHSFLPAGGSDALVSIFLFDIAFASCRNERRNLPIPCSRYKFLKEKNKNLLFHYWYVFNLVGDWVLLALGVWSCVA
jgi:hypothetical protein